MKLLNFIAGILIFLFAGYNNSWSQGWERSYIDSSGMGMGRDVIQTWDNGFVFTSDPAMAGGGQTAKLDGNGNIIWTTAIGGASVVETPDSGYIVGGTMGMTFAIRKLDQNGLMVWSHQLFVYGGQENIHHMIPVSSGGYVGCGFDNSDGIILKFDENGDTVWTHRTFRPGSDNFFEVAETGDGGFIVIGTRDSSALNVAWAVKFDSLGNEQWNKSYGQIFLQTICKTSDDCFVLAGYGNIVKIDNAGNALWNQTLSGNVRIYGIKEAHDQGLVAVGYKFVINENIWLAKLDSLANMEWSKTYHNGPEYDFAESINLVNDGGYIFIGSINYSGVLPVSSYIIRIDSLGNTYTNIVSGTVYYDYNSNCIFDSSDTYAQNVLMTGNGVNGNFVAFTDVMGNYEMHIGVGSYTITQQLPPYRDLGCPASLSFTVNFAGSNMTSPGHNYFDDIIPGIHDTRISLTAGPFRPGFNAKYWLNYKNKGTVTETGQVWMCMDTGLVFTSSVPPPDNIIADTLFWSYTNLEIDEERLITVNVQVPVTMVNGTQLFAEAFIDSIEIDVYPSDNMDTVYHVVTGSYDPNEKTSYCGNQDSTGGISVTDTLVYTIYFQNTGTDTAFTVKIIDVLDQNLDVTTFRMLGSSHAYSLQPVTDRIFKWVFNNILLPDSNINEPESHGFIKYSIRPKANVPAGTYITNEAKIYFDFNEPVITNTTSNVIVIPVGLDELDGDMSNNTIIQPNPFTTETLYQFPELHDGTLTIYNYQGKQVANFEKIQGTSLLIQRGNLESGIYLIRLMEGDRVVAVDKVIVMW